MIVEIVAGALTIILVAALFVLYKFNSSKNYWPRRGIKVATFPSMFPMGNSINTSFPALFSRANKWDLAQEQVCDPTFLQCYVFISEVIKIASAASALGDTKRHPRFIFWCTKVWIL